MQIPTGTPNCPCRAMAAMAAMACALLGLFELETWRVHSQHTMFWGCGVGLSIRPWINMHQWIINEFIRLSWINHEFCLLDSTQRSLSHRARTSGRKPGHEGCVMTPPNLRRRFRARTSLGSPNLTSFQGSLAWSSPHIEAWYILVSRTTTIPHDRHQMVQTFDWPSIGSWSFNIHQGTGETLLCLWVGLLARSFSCRSFALVAWIGFT